MTKIVQIRCPKCNTPLFAKEVDTVFICDSCGTVHVRDKGEPVVVECRAGQFTRPGEGDRVYLPFWALGVEFDISDLQIEGGGLSNLFGLLPAQSRNGVIIMYAPAYDAEPEAFKDEAMRMTSSPPKYEPGDFQPGAKRVPATLTYDLLGQIADFLFVTGVAEKPGVLQRLGYRLDIKSRSILYLPYYRKGESYQAGY